MAWISRYRKIANEQTWLARLRSLVFMGPNKRSDTWVIPFDQIEEAGRKGLVRTKQPSWVSPTLATLTNKHFADPKWIFEPKLDGVRCLVFRKGREIRLLSRNKKNLNDTYPELEEAIETQARDHFIVDGEIVAFEGGVTSFSRLQGRGYTLETLKKRVEAPLWFTITCSISCTWMAMTPLMFH